MNPWVQKSVELAINGNYLDRLHEVYGVQRPQFRDLDSTLVQQVVAAHGKQDPEEFFLTVLKLPVFPYDDPYVAFFRHSKDAFRKNPATLERISRWLLDLRIDQIMSMSARPMRSVKQFGQAFRKWWLGLPYPKAHGSAFQNTTLANNEIVILKPKSSQSIQFQRHHQDRTALSLTSREMCGLQK
jgi:hypothetical protein